MTLLGGSAASVQASADTARRARQGEARASLERLAKDPRLHDNQHPDGPSLRAQWRALLEEAYQGEPEEPERVQLFGVSTNPLVKTAENAAAGEMLQLMKSPAYSDQTDALHRTTVLRVQELMQVLHPDETDVHTAGVGVGTFLQPGEPVDPRIRKV